MFKNPLEIPEVRAQINEMNELVRSSSFNGQKFMTRLIWGEDVVRKGWIDKSL